jgi:hypothetical protein
VDSNDLLGEMQRTADEDNAARVTERALRAQLKLATTERDRLRSQLSLIESLETFNPHAAPTWLTPANPAKGHRATLCLLLTDSHLDEEVDPAQIDGLNAYNRHIAEMRLERFFTSSVKLAKHYLSGVTYDGVVLMLGGDIFSGNIHEELQRTNADTLSGSVLHWLDPMRAGFELLAREFGKVHVAGTPGNHGRMTRKPIAKSRAADNLDFLFYRLLAREFSKDDRFTWEIPTSADTHIQVYETRYLLTHGDQFRGGSGIAGALSPLLLGAHRKTKRQAYAGRPYDYMVLGHWHQTMAHKGLIVGGALKGYDEYAYIGNFDPEPPQQPLWITTPERGITFSAPVQVCDRAAEGW